MALRQRKPVTTAKRSQQSSALSTNQLSSMSSKQISGLIKKLTNDLRASRASRRDAWNDKYSRANDRGRAYRRPSPLAMFLSTIAYPLVYVWRNFLRAVRIVFGLQRRPQRAVMFITCLMLLAAPVLADEASADSTIMCRQLSVGVMDCTEHTVDDEGKIVSTPMGLHRHGESDAYVGREFFVDATLAGTASSLSHRCGGHTGLCGQTAAVRSADDVRVAQLVYEPLAEYRAPEVPPTSHSTAREGKRHKRSASPIASELLESVRSRTASHTWQEVGMITANVLLVVAAAVGARVLFGLPGVIGLMAYGYYFATGAVAASMCDIECGFDDPAPRCHCDDNRTIRKATPAPAIDDFPRLSIALWTGTAVLNAAMVLWLVTRKAHKHDVELVEYAAPGERVYQPTVRRCRSASTTRWAYVLAALLVIDAGVAFATAKDAKLDPVVNAVRRNDTPKGKKTTKATTPAPQTTTTPAPAVRPPPATTSLRCISHHHLGDVSSTAYTTIARGDCVTARYSGKVVTFHLADVRYDGGFRVLQSVPLTYEAKTHNSFVCKGGGATCGLCSRAEPACVHKHTTTELGWGDGCFFFARGDVCTKVVMQTVRDVVHVMEPTSNSLSMRAMVEVDGHVNELNARVEEMVSAPDIVDVRCVATSDSRMSDLRFGVLFDVHEEPSAWEVCDTPHYDLADSLNCASGTSVRDLQHTDRLVRWRSCNHERCDYDANFHFYTEYAQRRKSAHCYHAQIDGNPGATDPPKVKRLQMDTSFNCRLDFKNIPSRDKPDHGCVPTAITAQMREPDSVIDHESIRFITTCAFTVRPPHGCVFSSTVVPEGSSLLFYTCSTEAPLVLPDDKVLTLKADGYIRRAVHSARTYRDNVVSYLTHGNTGSAVKVLSDGVSAVRRALAAIQPYGTLGVIGVAAVAGIVFLGPVGGALAGGATAVLFATF